MLTTSTSINRVKPLEREKVLETLPVEAPGIIGIALFLFRFFLQPHSLVPMLLR